MKSKKFISHLGLLFLPCALAASIIVFIYNINSGDVSFGWGWAFVLAIVLDVVISWFNIKEERRHEHGSDVHSPPGS